MKAARVPYTQASADVVVTMNRAEAQELKEECEELADLVPAEVLKGDSPFARIYQELSRVLEPK
jgi:hypothetical protein